MFVTFDRDLVRDEDDTRSYADAINAEIDADFDTYKMTGKRRGVMQSTIEECRKTIICAERDIAERKEWIKLSQHTTFGRRCIKAYVATKSAKKAKIRACRRLAELLAK